MENKQTILNPAIILIVSAGNDFIVFRKVLKPREQIWKYMDNTHATLDSKRYANTALDAPTDFMRGHKFYSASNCRVQIGRCL